MKEAVIKEKISIKDMSMIGVVVALFCILSPMSITLPISVVPISLTNFVIYLMVYILGWKKGTISYLVYMLLGIVGLPIFSNHEGGLQKLAGATGGYLIGFIFMTLICGIVIEKYYKNYVFCFIAMVAGTAVTYVIGTGWLAHVVGVSFAKGLTLGVIPFIPGDIIKMVLALVIGTSARRALVKANLI